MAIVHRQQSSSSQPDQPQSTEQPPDTTSAAQTSDSPTRTSSALQTTPTSSPAQPTSSRQQSTADQTTTPRGTTTSPADTTSAPPTSTRDQTTSAPDSQTTSRPSQTSETITSQTPTQSSVISTTDSPTSRETSASSNAPPSTTRQNPVTTTSQPPTSSARPHTTSSVTSVVVTVVSSINGVPTTFTTVVPTLASSPNNSGISSRTTSIVGGVVGGTLALLGILVGLFYVSRRRRKLAAVRNDPRLQAPRQMLDTEDFDLADPPGPAPYAYGVVGARANPNASGSIFHEDLPGSATHSHNRSISAVGESDPLLAQHMHGGHRDSESITTTSPRESAHFRASSTTGLLYDAHDPFGDGRSDASSSIRTHPAASAKAREARSRGSDPHVYPPSAYHGPHREPQFFPMNPVGSGVVVHQDAGRVDTSGFGWAPPGYGDAYRPTRGP